MNPVTELIVEATCLTGVVLLAAAVSTPAFGGQRWGGAMWLRAAALLVVGLGYLFVNPRGNPDPFPVVIGSTVVTAVVVGLLVALTLAWRYVHRGQQTDVERQAAINFGAMGLFGLLAAACLVAAVICAVGVVQGVGDESAYHRAPSCAVVSSSSCRAQTSATVIRTWAEGSNGPHWIEVHSGDRLQTIQVETAYDVWNTLTPGQLLTSRPGIAITEVQVPGAGSMLTADSPGFGLIAAIALLGASFLGLMCFSLFGLVCGLKWRAASQGIDVDRVAA